MGDERLTLQHVKADAAELVDIWVVDLGEKANLGGRHRIVIGEEEFEVKDTAWSALVWIRPGKLQQWITTYPHKAIV